MENLISFCGFDCAQCPAYIAAQKDDDEARAAIAKRWSQQFGIEIRPEEINCDGCTVVEGRHIGYCDECDIRRCGISKGVENCAYCSDYPCSVLNRFFENAPEAKKTLDSIRASL